MLTTTTTMREPLAQRQLAGNERRTNKRTENDARQRQALRAKQSRPTRELAIRVRAASATEATRKTKRSDHSDAIAHARFACIVCERVRFVRRRSLACTAHACALGARVHNSDRRGRRTRDSATPERANGAREQVRRRRCLHRFSSPLQQFLERCAVSRLRCQSSSRCKFLLLC